MAKQRTSKISKPRPRILICTPEVTALPEGMGNAANHVRAKGGGLGDISADLIRNLFEDERFELHVEQSGIDVRRYLRWLYFERFPVATEDN